MIVSKVIGESVYIMQTYPIREKDSKGEWHETDSEWLDIERKQGNQTSRLKIPLSAFIELRDDLLTLVDDTIEAKKA